MRSRSSEVAGPAIGPPLRAGTRGPVSSWSQPWVMAFCLPHTRRLSDIHADGVDECVTAPASTLHTAGNVDPQVTMNGGSIMGHSRPHGSDLLIGTLTERNDTERNTAERERRGEGNRW